MKLYALTHRHAGAVLHIAKGKFTHTPENSDDQSKSSSKYSFEIVLSHSNSIELIGALNETNELKRICRQDMFGTIRSLRPFRLLGSKFDYLVVATDSGKFTILRFDVEEKRFVPQVTHTYGHTGCRRAIAGELLAVDLAGRAVMSAGVERQKIVYPLTRDENVPLKIASPLEANAQFTVNFDIASLDVGWDNPIFAALEVSYAEADKDHTGEAAKNAEKLLVYHEFDIGINSMKRSWAESTLRNANRILAVPSGNQNENGPGGSLVLSDGFVAYQKPDHDTLLARIPLRENSAPVIIVAYDTHLQAGSGNFFSLYKVNSEICTRSR